MIPPRQNAEFVAPREDVLETDETAYDPPPGFCLDEPPVPVLGETKVPLPATQPPAQRVDYESERQGSASIFRFAEPLSGFR